MKGLIFDNGDILFDASLWRRWLAEHLTSSGVPIGYEQLVPIWERHLVKVYQAEQDYWDAFNSMLSELGVPEEEHDDYKARAQSMGKQLQAQRKPMPKVPETLARLAEMGIRLAVLSDSESGESGVRRILDQLGVESHFDAVVSSFDIGVVKPEPAAFRAAADALGLELRDCAFVGHDVDELSGAQAVNLFAIGYNSDPRAPADVFIQDFDELIEIVRQQ